MPLVLEGLAGRPRAPRRRRAARGPPATSRVVGLRLTTGLVGGGAPLRRRQRDACAPRLRQTDRNRLLGGPRPVLSGADVVDLFSHELSRLSRRGLPLGLVSLRSSSHSLLGHRASPCLAAQRGPRGLVRGTFRARGRDMRSGARSRDRKGDGRWRGPLAVRAGGHKIAHCLFLTFPHVRYATCRCVTADGTCSR